MSETIALEHPFEHDGVRYTELVMRRAKKRDDTAARLAEKDPGEIETRMFANLCEVAPAVIEEMTSPDYLTVQDAFKKITSDGGTFEGTETGGRLTLAYPFEHGGVSHATVEMRHPKVREEKKSQKGARDASVSESRLFRMICDVPGDVLEEMDMADYESLRGGYRGFFGGRV